MTSARVIAHYPSLMLAVWLLCAKQQGQAHRGATSKATSRWSAVSLGAPCVQASAGFFLLTASERLSTTPAISAPCQEEPRPRFPPRNEVGIESNRTRTAKKPPGAACNLTYKNSALPSVSPSHTSAPPSIPSHSLTFTLRRADQQRRSETRDSIALPWPPPDQIRQTLAPARKALSSASPFLGSRSLSGARLLRPQLNLTIDGCFCANPTRLYPPRDAISDGRLDRKATRL